MRKMLADLAFGAAVLLWANLALAQDPVAYLEPVFGADGAVTNYATASVPAGGYTLWQDRDLSDVTLAAGWHVIAGNCTVGSNASLKVGGDVRLILGNGATLTKEKGCQRCGFVVEEGSLTVYAQSTDERTMGAMEIYGGDYSAAIGTGESGDRHDNAPITINGGRITAVGGYRCAGIGAGKYGNGADITINGGVITAAGGSYGAGIGGGYHGQGTNITVNGGIVLATGGWYGAGIGGGDGAVGRHITIRGGDVTATGGYYGAAIGGGNDGAGEDILIADGTVRAEGLRASAIGGGSDGAGTNVVLCGGSVSVVMEDDYRSAFAPVDAASNRVYEVVVSNVFNGSDGRVKVTGLTNYGCDSLSARDGRLSLWLPNGNYSFTVGDRACYAHVAGAATQAVFTEDLPPVTYRTPVLDANGVLTGFEDAVCSDYTPVLSAGGTLHFDSGWYVVAGTNEAWQGVEVVGDVKLILTDGSSLRAWPTNAVGQAGVHVVPATGKLTVYAQSSDEATMGELIAIGGANGAGIGGNADEAGHDISINGGKVTARGTLGGAAIGGGSGGDGYNIVISGGRVQALTIGTGAGIGGGNGGCGHEILVRGGTVSFSKDAASSHIGSGQDGAAPSGLYIGGGSVLTTTSKVGCVVRNRQLAPVYPTAVQELAEGPATVTGLSNYGTNDLTVVDGELILWLPAGTHVFAVNGASKTVVVEGQGEPAHDPVTYLSPLRSGEFVTGFAVNTCETYYAIDAFTTSRSLASGWYVVTGTFELGDGLDIDGDVKLILKDGAHLKVGTAGRSGHPGISVESGDHLTVYAQSENPSVMGELTVCGGYNAPGIGGTNYDVTINGGKVTATGGASAAGIGSSCNVWDGTSSLTVNGGVVTATGGGMSTLYGPATGIGDSSVAGAKVGSTSGSRRYTCVTVRGGRVTAVGSNVGGSGSAAYSDIGLSDHGWMSSTYGDRRGQFALKVYGGTVSAGVIGDNHGDSSSVLHVRITGGSVVGHVMGVDPVVATLTGDVQVYCAELVCGWANGERIAVTGLGDYGTRDVFSSYGKICPWLTNGSYEVSANGFHREFKVKNGSVSEIANVSYLEPVFDVDGAVTNYVTAYTPLEGYTLWQDRDMSGVTLSAGWHVIAGNCTINKASSLKTGGDVKLILKDKATLKKAESDKHRGFIVQKGSSLTVYAQSTDVDNMGVMTIYGGDYCAAIGSGDPDDGNPNAPITINGGKITAAGGKCSAGIGSSKNADASRITINGGIVTATGGKYGAGIGGGEGEDGKHGKASNITINGGKVTATGGEKAAGIGGGRCGAGHDISINGGEVWASCPDHAAGIGGGDDSDGYNIFIRGGFVNAICSDNGAAGIGAGGDGKGGQGHDIIISGGTVIAQGDENGDSIGSAKGGKAPYNIVFTGGSIIPYKNDFGEAWPTNAKGQAVYEVTVSGLSGLCTVSGLENYGTKDLNTYGGKLHLWLPNGTYDFTVNGTNYVATVDGTKQSYDAQKKVVGGLPYLDYDSSSNALTNATCACYIPVSQSDTSWGRAGETTWYAAEGSVTIPHTVEILGDVRLILKDSCQLTVNGGRDEDEGDKKRGAAIWQAKDDSSFTVYGQSMAANTMGMLMANAAACGAGIGGGDPNGADSYWAMTLNPPQFVKVDSGKDQRGHHITINGGYVKATGNKGGAGIGGGQDYAGHDITINGGIVNATGGKRGGAGIGGGGANADDRNETWGDARNIRITGGLVTARGGAAEYKENEDKKLLVGRIIETTEAWGCGTDIGGGGSYQIDYSRKNTLKATVASMIPGVGDAISLILWKVDKVLDLVGDYHDGGTCDTVTIMGGTVDAPLIGGSSQTDFKIAGGSVMTGVFAMNPVNASGQQLYMVDLRMSKEEAASLVVPDYDTRDINPQEASGNTVCLWLPSGYREIAYGGKRYALVVYGMNDYTLSYLGYDLNVTVNGTTVKDGTVVPGCSYSSSEKELTIDNPGSYVIAGAENAGRVKLIVKAGADLVFSNLLLTAGNGATDTASPVSFASNTRSTVMLCGANYLASQMTQDNNLPLVCNGCGIHVPNGVSVTFRGDGSLMVIGGGNAAAIGSLPNESCGDITIASGRIRVCGGEGAACIGSGKAGGGGSVIITGGWISTFGAGIYTGVGCGSFDAHGTPTYPEVPVTITGGTLNLVAIRGTTRVDVPSGLTSEEVTKWWAEHARVVIDGGVFNGDVWHAGNRHSFAINSREQIVYCESSPYVGLADGELITNLTVSAGGYGTNDIRSIDGYAYLWLPTNAVVQRVDPDGTTVDMTGLTINGCDIAWGSGDGWTCDGSVVTLTGADQYLVREGRVGTERDVRFDVQTNATLMLDGVNAVPSAGAPVQVADGLMLNLLLRTDNRLASSTSAAGVDLGSKAVVCIDRDPSDTTNVWTLAVSGGVDAPGLGTRTDGETGVRILGGTVTATGGNGAAGIGSGPSGRTSYVEIFGGRVTADRIGRGTTGGTGGDIVITGGSVETDVLGASVGVADAPKITITGGSVKAGAWNPQQVEASGLVNVHDTRVGYPWAGPARVEGLGDYGTNDLYAATDGFLHFWLPASYDTKTIVIDGVGEVPLELVTTSLVGGRAFTRVEADKLRTDYTKETAELVAANALVVRPNEDVENVVGPLVYGSYFKVTPQPTGVGENYTLDVDFTEATKQKLHEDFTEALPALVETVTNAAPTTSVRTLAGLYYGIAGSTNVLDVKEAEVPVGETKLGVGNPVELKGERPIDATDKAFYQLRAERQL